MIQSPPHQISSNCQLSIDEQPNSTTTIVATSTISHHNHHHQHSHHQQIHHPQPSPATSIVCNTETSSNPRSSTSSNSSSLGEFLSDDSSVFEDNLDAFHDIQILPENDPFALLLNNDSDQVTIVT